MAMDKQYVIAEPAIGLQVKRDHMQCVKAENEREKKERHRSHTESCTNKSIKRYKSRTWMNEGVQ